MTMTKKALTLGVALVGLTVGAWALQINAVEAGECPADQIASGANQGGPTAHSGANDTVLSMIDLAEESIAAEDRLFRMRRLEIQPGGEIAMHSHEDRPALIYVVQGEIYEYASTCATPILHKAGEISTETHDVAHWWKNESDQVVILISADILHDAADASSM